MSYKQSAYPNLLMGVSQQVPFERLPGQLSEQINMVSDPVSGLRRRSGIELMAHLLHTDQPWPRPFLYHTNLGGRSIAMLVAQHRGELYLFDERDGRLLMGQPLVHDYLKANDYRQLRAATVADDLFIANLSVKPEADRTDIKGVDPNKAGWLYIKAGQYSKAFSMTIKVKDNATGTTYSHTATYVTPDNASTNPNLAEAPFQTSVGYIAWQLYGKFFGAPEYTLPNSTKKYPKVDPDANAATIAGYLNQRGVQDGYIAFRGDADIHVEVSTDMGNNYGIASGGMSLNATADLPALLPGAGTPGVGVQFMDGAVMATGSTKAPVYFEWDSANRRWAERAAYGTDWVLKKMPLALRWDEATDTYSLNELDYDRRGSGDEDTNPTFNFVTRGITGMTTFQGRLVLLSQEYVCMSASNNPHRWFKKSAAALNDDDPIEIAAQGSLTEPYEHAVTFNKDLIVFAKKYQAVVPGGGIVTPRTAVISITTQYDLDTRAAPAVTGRSVYFAAERALGFMGLHEMAPSPSTDSHYVAEDVTSHIPSYMPGPAEYIQAAASSGYLVFGTSTADEMICHQYLWQGNEKVQNAFHRWTLRHQIIGAYFTGDNLMVLIQKGQEIALGRMHLNSLPAREGLQYPKYDYWRRIEATVDGELELTKQHWDLIKDASAVYQLQPVAGAYMERTHLGVKRETNTKVFLDVPEAVVGAVYVVGCEFWSKVEFTPPVLRDHNGLPMTSTRAVLHRYNVNFGWTGEFLWRISDTARPNQPWYDTTPLRLFSRQLNAGEPLVDSAVVPLPARVDMATSKFELSCHSPYDMNVRAVEYNFKSNQTYRRV
ncbi:putative tail tubular protein B [Pseudomonas phage vB_PaeA_55_1W]|uniref:Tail tubular protein B n=1 Tax=Pseudomonas phage vB_PaeA_55_1W TaxID=2863830 RepID=A0ABX9AFT4_9CAUD|nr:putative tail tubular protein B [Pseudomonas phage vB_PaeA_55_1W]